ncbi:Inosose dehydratase [Polystyrenella longa]|uniref:Inosose dehydratase n=1 Tax=Polystyrenella longa TaxID=2528007 RepID=A0A518CLY9_9PLAN|nr:sugar phosphate isomerase/epimerase [Polystyrenella longa]QDU80238.1 Inosose dehydratase [Polystyrenella longa]
MSIQGPAVFLAQFVRDEAPFDNIKTLGPWFAEMGYKGIQIPTGNDNMIEIDKAVESSTYCDEYLGMLKDMGLVPTELSGHLQGQVLAMHPAYAKMFEVFHPPGLSMTEVSSWATAELKKLIEVSAKLGTKSIPAMSGGFAWHMVYPWPQRPEGVIEEAFSELAKRWLPIFDHAEEHGVTITFELHPGSDVYDGATFEMLLDQVKGHPACCINYDPSHFVLQQLDYLDFIRLYGDRIKAFHVKDAEFRPSGRVGVYSGYQSWDKRAGRFRSLGDGQVDFKQVFTLLTEAGYDGWAVLEWECCIKDPEQGAREGAPFIADHIIKKTPYTFDDFAGGATDTKRNREILGLD